MRVPLEIPFGRPEITDDDRNAVLEVLRGPILAHGPQSRGFQSDFAAFMGSGAHCVATSSCMAALHLAYLELGIGPGDEVLVPALTHVATAHAVEIVGARPVFVDCDPRTGNVDLAALDEAVTARTRVLSLVHFLGIPCDMDAVQNVALRHDLRVVEDCALAVGARWREVHVGLTGDAGCFSFYPVKHITCGEGGMFTSRDPEVAARVARQGAFGVDRNHGERAVPGVYDVPVLGLNYRMSELQAVLGRSQMQRIDVNLAHRRRIFRTLSERVLEVEGVSVLDTPDPNATSSHYALACVLDGPLADKRDKLVLHLKERGVGTSVYYPHPVPRLAYYRERYGWDESAFPNAVRISDRSIALPVAPHVSEDQAHRIADAFADAAEEAGS